MRIVFMGTPDFSVPTLESLVGSRHQVVAVVTQPDKPRGRGREIQMSPVKEVALRHRIPVFQPVRARDGAFIAQMRELAPDVMVVVAFGQILSEELLQVPVYGCMNIHASLLPKYRGAAPIQWAVINGDDRTGITIQMMDAGVDTGDVVATQEVKLDGTETGGSLFDRLSRLGGDLILSALERLEKGTLVRTPQDHAQATHVKKISKEFGNIDWTRDAAAIERLVRGLNPWPSAYTYYQGKMLKIWESQVVEEKTEDGQPARPEAGEPAAGRARAVEAVAGMVRAGDPAAGTAQAGTPGAAGRGVCGEVLEASGDSLLVGTGQGILKICSLQLEGKKRMDTAAFLRGFQVEPGSVLTQTR